MKEDGVSPHVLIFPFPIQGHVNSMLKLAELQCLADIHVSFLVPFSVHSRLIRHTDVQSRFASFHGFRFQTFAGELSELQFDKIDELMKILEALTTSAKPFLRNLLLSELERRPVTCAITDGILSLALEVGIPVIYFRTISACAFWSYFCIPELIKAGEIPFNESEMDIPVRNVDGMEDLLRRRDLPSFCRCTDLTDSAFQMLLNETRQTSRAVGFILNTFEDLEGPILSHIRTKCQKLYSIGPLHAHLKARGAAKTSSSNSLWEEDKSCMRWLDDQPPQSVIYVSFGSITVITKDQLMEFWHGLINSGKNFLWAIKQDSIAGKDGESRIPVEILEGTGNEGYFVGWAPQEEVLAHPAIGAFLTHSGWNSTLESIVEGVPMICWPFFADQQVNSRFVGEAWKLGLDMKDSCDRVVIEKMVKDLMEERRDEFLESAKQMATLARNSIGEGGSSYSNLDLLINDIRCMALNSSLNP